VSVLDNLRRVESDLIARMRELRPLVDEYVELQQTARRLGVDLPRDACSEPLQRAASPPVVRPPGPDRTAVATRRRRAQARPGERREQIMALVAEQPGITVRELGAALRVDPTSLYRPVRELTESGAVRKDGPQLHIAG
jgi:hypothetical protein